MVFMQEDINRLSTLCNATIHTIRYIRVFIVHTTSPFLSESLWWLYLDSSPGASADRAAFSRDSCCSVAGLVVDEQDQRAAYHVSGERFSFPKYSLK